MSLLLVLVPVLALAPQAPAAGGPPPAPDANEPRGLRTALPEAFTGYTLLAPLASKFTTLVDMQGRAVHRWTSAYAPSSCYLLDDGSILRTARLEDIKKFSGGGICGRVERIGWDGELLWSYELANEDQTSHHDARPLPNGNVLLIAWEFRYREDCLAAGRDPAHTTDKGLWPDALLEIKPTPPSGGTLVWEWHAWDHLVQDVDPAADHHGKVAEHPELIDLNYDLRETPALSPEEQKKQAELEAQMRALGYAGGDEDEADSPAPGPQTGVAGGAGLPPTPSGNGQDWMHTNAVDYDPGLDLIVVSSPELSEVWILDHSTTTEQAASHSGGRYKHGGDLLWRWGNPINHGHGTKEDRRLFYQHNVQWIPPGRPGAGHLLVFNNGQGRPDGEHSEIAELVLPLEVGKGFACVDGAYGPKEPAWKYSDPERFFSPFISGCQRLPNGDTLICEGPKGRVFEVTSAGKIVWEFWNPFGGDLKSDGTDGRALFRATRVAPDHPGLHGRTLAPLADEPAAK
jgi:hypothetical protein